ncbi:hypothetical protein GW17_00033823 [Ensete ventricosum]|uniref:Uncharacterized protein n=1 Tax=Ensete ventricosum TaxID=4639 RepID=A0A444DVT6_ENSVE|nr:hypothetical protein B296_00055527 [Ensete ventricosum]RWW02251.1 hypothetical protein GW17_00033823 [Ensete ventricosum]RZR95694.1 hypothetical protein BHM03_00024566 [Ensete ventricosum]
MVPNARLIDGILLTKFDTIDDKVVNCVLSKLLLQLAVDVFLVFATCEVLFVQVGAALSMVYVSGAPVMFVGCGQSYTDLKKLNIKSIVKTLIK